MLELTPHKGSGKKTKVVRYDMKIGKQGKMEFETLADDFSSLSYSTTIEEESTTSDESDSSGEEVMGIILIEPNKVDPLDIPRVEESKLAKMLAKDLTEEEKQAYMTMLEDFPRLFIEGYDQITGVIVMQHHINLKEGSKPTVQWLRRLGVIQQDALLAEVRKLLNASFIYPTEDSEWVSPVVVTPKKNGKWRVCVDCKPLNVATKRNHFPLPFQDKILDEVAGYERFGGVTLEILSDREPGFKGDLVGELMKKLKIKRRHSTPYYPQCNGLVGKVNDANVEPKQSEFDQGTLGDEQQIEGGGLEDVRETKGTHVFPEETSLAIVPYIVQPEIPLGFDTRSEDTLYMDCGEDILKKTRLFSCFECPLIPLCKLIPYAKVRGLRDDVSGLKTTFGKEGYVQEKGAFIVSIWTCDQEENLICDAIMVQIHKSLNKKLDHARLTMPDHELQAYEEKEMGELATRFGDRIGKILNIVDPKLGDDWSQKVLGLKWESDSYATLEKLNLLAIHNTSIKVKTMWLSLLEASNATKIAYALPRGDHLFRV
ncbi:hypothetical protein L7F22_013006 [Adiantum nelumboides]|nr:hypothetical protein [Adiantum nelumboides]